MTLHIRLTEAEQEALNSMPSSARVLYMLGLRPYMDYASGVVGVQRRISLQGFRELLEYEPDRGSRLGARYTPTKDEVRNEVDRLVRSGLLLRLPKKKRNDPLVFKLPLADCDAKLRLYEEPHMNPIGRTPNGATKHKTKESCKNRAFSSHCATSSAIDDATPVSADEPHTSVYPLSNNNNAREASPSGLGAPTHGKTSVDQWEPCSETWGILRAQGVDPVFAQEKLPSYRIYWRDRGEVRHSWSSHFVNYVIGQWRRYGWQWKQEVGNEASKVRSGGGKGRESLVDRVERKSEEWLRRRHAASEAEGGVIDGEVVAENEPSLRV
ncbi:DnaT-like ssDNA-binding domain-containing protein [Spongiibacter tropicus]|uniref:DnaT-like ssDNA-binding domain-containing protein n=1 Tax=Spongiibacter tropicus TaxID=454602 RepID=UPI0003B73ED4|nr:DnaT-like ssDNA-binding domain-containing protein [Spongiibacter tropicus]